MRSARRAARREGGARKAVGRERHTVSVRVAADGADEVVFLHVERYIDILRVCETRSRLSSWNATRVSVPFNRHSSRAAAGYAVVHRRGAMRNEFDILFEVRRHRNRTFLLPGSLLPTTVSLTTSPNAHPNLVVCFRRKKSTQDALKPLRAALEGVLTDANKPYVLMLLLLLAPLLLFAAHRVEQREKRAAEAVDQGKKKD